MARFPLISRSGYCLLVVRTQLNSANDATSQPSARARREMGGAPTGGRLVPPEGAAGPWLGAETGMLGMTHGPAMGTSPAMPSVKERSAPPAVLLLRR